jgi:Domain of Unknown Function with PDB structure (DUF3857)/Transglutaminase-like superfamily
MRRALTKPPRFFVHRRFRIGRMAAAIAAAPLCLASNAQAPTPPPATARAAPAGQSNSSAPIAKTGDQSKEALVFDKLYTKIREESDGTGTRQTTARVRVLADAGVKEMAVLTFTYISSNQQIDIGYVRVIKPDGTVVDTPDYNVQDLPADVTREAPMYSDIHQKHVAVRGLGVGDTLEYQWMLRTLKPDVPGQFWLEYMFEKDLIILDEQLDLDIPADKQVTVASADLQPTTTTADGRKLYHWTSSNLARPDPDAPPKSVKKLKPSVQVTTFKSWEEVGAWYDSLQKGAVVVTPAIQARAVLLTKGLTSDDDKVRVIFNDVAMMIHYVALDFGIGRYQPHAADDVLANEYGDCKDKHTLLAALLKAAGIEAWPVLISSGRELDADTPSPAQFDHVITLVKLKDKTLWMDSTEEVAPVGMLMATLRDKEALAIPVGKAAYLEHTPADLPYLQTSRFEINGTVSDQGAFTAQVAQSYHGDVELVLRYAFRGVPQSQWKQFMQNFSNGIGFGGDVSNVVVSSVEQTAQPFQFSYDYKREKLSQWDDRRVSPPLPPVGIELVPGVKQIKPADDVDLGSPGELVYKSTMQLPKGWIIVPQQSADIVDDWAEYHAKYEFSDGAFTAERYLLVKKDKVPLSDWDKYLDFRRGIYADEERTEPILHAGFTDPGSSSTVMELGPSALVEEMLQDILPLRDAVNVLLSNQPQTPDGLAKTATDAQNVLDTIESRSIRLSGNDPHSLYWTEGLATAWFVRGWSALAVNDLPTAETYLRAAWKLNQDPLSGFLLGWLLEVKQDRVSAAHQYELAHISSANSLFGGFSPQADDIRKRIADGYKRVTGRELTATPLNHGTYDGSLQAEIDKANEIHQFVHATKLTGEALYMVDSAPGAPAKVSMISGDKGFEQLGLLLQSHGFTQLFPKGSKARLLREVRIVCSPYSGCDAYQLLPGSIRMPSREIHIIPTRVPSSNGSNTVQIKQLPAQPQ